ncbi:MAG: hypothetical protein FWC10_04155 [Lentimicrobiaceae bacterium]|nr:hypothetical protein [Lentimicrobiaceae bacterium]
MKCKTTLKQLRNIQIFWGLFIGIGAYFGAITMIAEPSGETFKMVEMLPYFQKLPFAEIFFQDFLFSGIALLIVNGLTNTISLALIFKRNKYAALSGMLCGIILMLWISVQFYIFELNFMSTLYFIFGILQALNGWKYLKCSDPLFS